ncbi:MAG: aspartate-semialdehyde dehydrogenase [Spirochaetaceae bacterium]|jgi:aspartate-semialdehyde dehydrogenase|nr:aspartate-semialdehyde dehydrogenase [Spirochaetaceae bacterium]
MKKIPVGILGATGMVGQNYIAMLAGHPWFEVNYVAASLRSAGKKYGEAMSGRWLLPKTYQSSVAELVIENANDISRAEAAAARGELAFVFSALEMGKEDILALENSYAAAGIPVVSNASANRWTDDVPMLIAEVNPDHADIIPSQRSARGWNKGFIAVKPNCSIQSYVTPLWALLREGCEIKRMIVTTMQAVSGAGYPGVASLDVIDNVVPYIGGEEEKSELEPLKILGTVRNGKIEKAAAPLISAHCNRVPVINGHTATISVEFGAKKPSVEQVKQIWTNFSALPQELKLPLAPEQPIIVRNEDNRPQPNKDRDAYKGMAVSVGRIRPCPVFDLRFVGLSHNTARGAAGGGILNAELLKAKGYIA